MRFSTVIRTSLFILTISLVCTTAHARYLQSDPIGIAGGDVNLYAYVHNSPLNYVDPFGLLDVFVGGAGDADSKIVSTAAQQFRNANPGRNVAYFSWDQTDAIIAAILSAKCADPYEPINLIGHSYGGDTAANVALELLALGNKADLLITADPVRSVGEPDLPRIAQSATTWINLNAVGGSWLDWSNIIAGVGTAWNNRPRSYATTHQKVDVTHANFPGMLRAQLPGGSSVLDALLASTMGQPFKNSQCGCY